MAAIIIKTARYNRDGSVGGTANIDGETVEFRFHASDMHPLSGDFKEALAAFNIEPFVPSEIEQLADESAALHKLLEDTDYKAIKATENGGTLAEINPVLAAQRQAARERINAIDARIAELIDE